MVDKNTDEPSEDVVAEARKARSEKRGFFGRISLFISQVVAELKKVIAPTRQELVRMTLVVLGFVVVMIAIVWALDQLFGWLAVVVFGNPNL
ncbi:MAG: preprotein translocase subunit SecE [Microbacteriaceae bacterium]